MNSDEPPRTNQCEGAGRIEESASANFQPIEMWYFKKNIVDNV